MAEGYYLVEDFDKLAELAESLGNGDPILNEIGDRFVTVGICE